MKSKYLLIALVFFMPLSWGASLSVDQRGVAVINLDSGDDVIQMTTINTDMLDIVLNDVRQEPLENVKGIRLHLGLGGGEVIMENLNIPRNVHILNAGRRAAGRPSTADLIVYRVTDSQIGGSFIASGSHADQQLIMQRSAIGGDMLWNGGSGFNTCVVEDTTVERTLQCRGYNDGYSNANFSEHEELFFEKFQYSEYLLGVGNNIRIVNSSAKRGAFYADDTSLSIELINNQFETMYIRNIVHSNSVVLSQNTVSRFALVQLGYAHIYSGSQFNDIYLDLPNDFNRFQTYRVHEIIQLDPDV